MFIFEELEKISFEEFKKILPKVWKEEDPIKELRNAFDVFDPTNNGFLTPEQLKHVMMGFGENLDENDFKELMKTIPVQPDDTINVEGLSNKTIKSRNRFKLMLTQFFNFRFGEIAFDQLLMNYFQAICF